MRIESYAISNQGRVRTRNEDSFLKDDEDKLYVVADGMGGHAGGDRASRIAVEGMKDFIAKAMRENPVDKLSTSQSGLEVEARMISAVRAANALIFSESADQPELRGMGTTTTSVIVTNGQATFAHVGDSRAYLLRGDMIRQITEDHSWVNEQVKAGFITAEEARNHRLKNVITRSLGHEKEIKVDVLRLDLKVGDSYLLCSDGLTNMMRDEEIREIVAEHAPNEAMQALVDLANERGGYDNITAVMVRVVDG